MPDTNLVLGRGRLYFDQFTAGTQTPTGELYFGNTPEAALNVETEELEHFSSDAGIREKDDSVTLQVTRGGSFSCDNILRENLALWWFGSAETYTQVAPANVTAEAHDGILQDREYQLGTSVAFPAGVRDVSSVVVKDDGSPPTTFTLTDDYLLDADLARLTVVVGGAITDGTNLRVNYTRDAHSHDKVVSGNDPIEGAMRFLAVNPKGENHDYFFPWVKIKPNGDFALKGDEWQTLPFTFEILKKTGLEGVYIDGRPGI